MIKLARIKTYRTDIMPSDMQINKTSCLEQINYSRNCNLFYHILKSLTFHTTKTMQEI